MSERLKPNWLARAGAAMILFGGIGWVNSGMNIRTNNAQTEVIETITTTPLPRASSTKLAEIGETYKEKLARDMERHTDIFAVSGLLMLGGSSLLYVSRRKNTPKQQ